MTLPNVTMEIQLTRDSDRQRTLPQWLVLFSHSTSKVELFDQKIIEAARSHHSILIKNTLSERKFNAGLTKNSGKGN